MHILSKNICTRLCTITILGWSNFGCEKISQQHYKTGKIMGYVHNNRHIAQKYMYIIVDTHNWKAVYCRVQYLLSARHGPRRRADRNAAPCATNTRDGYHQTGKYPKPQNRRQHYFTMCCRHGQAQHGQKGKGNHGKNKWISGVRHWQTHQNGASAGSNQRGKHRNSHRNGKRQI